MNRKAFHFAIGALALSILLSSCSSLPDPLGLFGKKASDRLSAEAASATGLTGFNRKLMFNMVYAQVFFVGGFGADLYALEETQGTIWRVESRDENGNVSKLESERALLKKLPNGDQWWFLAWRPEGDAIEFEALMTSAKDAKKIRYFNKDVNRVEEAVFDETAKKDAQNAPPPDAAAGSMTRSDLAKLIKGKETITVGSGTYNTDRMEWTFTDQEEKTTYKYTWWVDAKVPGGLVKYLWTKEGSKQSLGGELYSINKGYKTKFSSF